MQIALDIRPGLCLAWPEVAPGNDAGHLGENTMNATQKLAAIRAAQGRDGIRFQGWDITGEEREDGNGIDFYLMRGKFSCSLTAAQNEGWAEDGDGNATSVPQTVIHFAESLEEFAADLADKIKAGIEVYPLTYNQRRRAIDANA